MTAPSPPGFDQLIAALAGLSSKLAGREGNAIREHVQQLASILAQTGPDAALRTRAAAELEKLVDAVVQLGASKRASTPAVRGMDLTKVAAGLRMFAEYLRAPTSENQAAVTKLFATVQGATLPPPVALDELQIDGTVEEVAIESARRHGLEGAELQQAVARMKREMSVLVQQLERRAKLEASRAQTAAEFERLFDAVVNTGSELGQAIAAERAPIIQAFRSVDLAHMAEGLRVFAAWLSTPAQDPAAHVAELRARFTETLGPPTTGDPARSDDERRADFEREIKAAVDEIFLRTRSSP